MLNVTDLLERAATDICARLPEFAHIDLRRVLLLLTQARSSSAHGTYAKIVPMRFGDGTPLKQVRGATYALPQLPTPHGDVLYLIYVYVPRFFEQPTDRRLLTLVHELYHISPAFDGTIRKVGRGSHGASRQAFNTALEPMVQRYLAADAPPHVTEALTLDIRAAARTAAIVGRTLSLPKAVRVG
jgi:hypothetical protein